MNTKKEFIPRIMEKEKWTKDVMVKERFKTDFLIRSYKITSTC